MLTRDHIELIQQEIDGANTPEQSAACRSLIEQDPEARALADELRSVALILERVGGEGERDPPPRLKPAILAALPRQPRAIWWDMLTDPLQAIQAALRGGHMKRKAIIIAGTAVLAIGIIVAGAATGFPPLFDSAGTIGGIPGVGQAARYQGRAMTEADVTLKNPEIQALFQNDRILRLVKSDAFREAMQNAAFRELQANEAYQQLMANELYRELMANEFYRELQASEAFHELQARGAFRQAQSAEFMRELQANAAYQELQANAAYQELQANAAFRELQASAAFQQLAASEAYHELMANELYRELQSSEMFRELQASEAFWELQSAELFRALSRSPELSAVFMREAMLVQQ